MAQQNTKYASLVLKVFLLPADLCRKHDSVLRAPGKLNCLLILPTFQGQFWILQMHFYPLCYFYVCRQIRL